MLPFWRESGRARCDLIRWLRLIGPADRAASSPVRWRWRPAVPVALRCRRAVRRSYSVELILGNARLTYVPSSPGDGRAHPQILKTKRPALSLVRGRRRDGAARRRATSLARLAKCAACRRRVVMT
jgi:hypothetical protein